MQSFKEMEALALSQKKQTVAVAAAQSEEVILSI